AKGGTFTPEILQQMARLNSQPIIFALSNPTTKAECTAEEAYLHTKGQAIFASGSPFDPVIINGEMRVPGQGNNAYIFPGLGLGVLHGKVTRITDDLLIAAAKALAEGVTTGQLNAGCLYPPLTEIREVSLRIAVAVAESAALNGLTRRIVG